MPLHAWRALYACAVEAVLAGYADDPVASSFVLWDRLGPSVNAMSDNLRTGLLRLEVVAEVDADPVHLRLSALADEEFVPLCSARARSLGADEDEVRVLAMAEAAAHGLEPERVWLPTFDEDET